jgi:hypothetical protein
VKPQAGELLATFETCFKAMDLLERERLIQPCLVVLFSTMDAAAWLSVAGDGDVSRDEFVRWVDHYVLPGAPLRCGALDLYAARCAMLHSMTAFSRLSREGKARTLSYAWGSASVEDLHIVIRFLGRTDIVGIHLSELKDALRSGFQSFLIDIAGDSARLGAVLHRASMLYSHLPIFPVSTLAARASTSDGA